MLRAVFFDLDDTLVDTSKLAERARRNAIEMMIRHGLPVEFEVAYKELMEVIKEYGSNFSHHFDYLLRRLDLKEDPKLIAAGVIGYHNTKFTQLRSVKGVGKVLLKLKEMGLTLGIITDGNPVKQWEKIIRTELEDYFDAVFISDFLGVKKPHERIFKKALEFCNLKPEEALMVGDRLYSDIYGAKRVGMRTVWFKYGKHAFDDLDFIDYADFTIRTMDELIPLVEELLQEGSP